MRSPSGGKGRPLGLLFGPTTDDGHRQISRKVSNMTTVTPKTGSDQEWRSYERLLVEFFNSHQIEVQYRCGCPVIDVVRFHEIVETEDHDGELIATDDLSTLSVTDLAEYLARELAEVR
jgi:hypothetical protein